MKVLLLNDLQRNGSIETESQKDPRQPQAKVWIKDRRVKKDKPGLLYFHLPA